MDSRRDSVSNLDVATNEVIEGIKSNQDDLEFNHGDSHIDAVKLKDVIIETTLQSKTAQEQATKILAAFNEGIKHDWYTRSNFRGERINPGEFLLGAYNKQPKLAGYQDDNKNIARKLNPLSPSDIAEYGLKVRATDSYYGMYGRHVLNVPVDKYVKAMSGNKPLLFGPGPHVIHDPNLQFTDAEYDPGKDQIDILAPYINHHTIHILRVTAGKVAAIWIGNDPLLLPARPEPYVFNDPLFKKGSELFIDQSNPYIHHGTIHIVRVPKGKIAKVWVNNKPVLLEYRDKPYTFVTPYFKIDAASENDYFIDQSNAYIQHGTIHVIRVPKGKVAKVWVDNQPLLLEYQDKAYEFTTPYFKIEKASKDELFVDQSNPYIQHGTIHILRVPKGKIAKVWSENKPLLLEYQDEPYEFTTPYFKIEGASRDELFFDATAQKIVHGQIKRIIPHTGEVAITYDNGTLVVMPPSGNSKPITLDSPTHEFVDFLSTNVQTLVFPSEKTKNERKRDNPNASADEIALEVFQTRDSLSVGVKLLVAYKIVDPEKAVSQLGKDGIVPHVENLATVDMGKAIKQCSSQDFLTFWQNKPVNSGDGCEPVSAPAAMQPRHFQDIVKDALAKDLLEYGIELVRLNIETTKTLNKDIAEQMEQQAKMLAETNAKEAALAQKTRITVAESQQKAEAARIAQEQQNNATKSKAQAELDAAKLRAEALLVTARAEQEAAALQGRQFRDYPELVQIKKAELQSAALSRAPIMMQPQMMPGMFGNPFSLFNNSQAVPVAEQNLVNEEARKPAPGGK